MTKQSILIALVSALIAGCAKDTPTDATQLSQDKNLTGSKVEVIAEGGIAALDIRHVVRQDDRVFVYTQRHLCNNNCAATDSVSGSLSAATTLAEFDKIPEDCGATMMLIIAVPLPGKLPRLHVTVPVPEHVPWVGVVETKLTPAGRLSVATTFVAGEGPLFVTVNR